MIKFSLWLSLEDPEDWLVLKEQLLQRFVPEGCFSVQQAQCSAWSCRTERSNFWLEPSFCDQTISMPHHSFFMEMLSFSYGVLSVKFALYCIVKLRPTPILYSAPSYWLSHFSLLKIPFIILTRRSQVDVFWTGLQCTKLFSIIMVGNIFKDNIATFRRGVRSFRRNMKFRCFS